MSIQSNAPEDVPGANDSHGGDVRRQRRGVVIATQKPIEKQGLVYKVSSQSGNGFYIVSVDDDDPTCTCPDFV